MRDSELRINRKEVIIGTAFFIVLFILSFAFFDSYRKTVEDPDPTKNISNIRKQSVEGSKVIFGIALIVLAVIGAYNAVKINYSYS